MSPPMMRQRCLGFLCSRKRRMKKKICSRASYQSTRAKVCIIETKCVCCCIICFHSFECAAQGIDMEKNLIKIQYAPTACLLCCSVDDVDKESANLNRSARSSHQAQCVRSLFIYTQPVREWEKDARDNKLAPQIKTTNKY